MTSVPPIILPVERFSCTSRPLHSADAPAVVELVHAYERVFVGRPLLELEDVQSAWQRPSFDLAAQSVGVFAGDALVACAQVAGRRAEGCVHPDRRGEGIGTALAQWSEQLARRLRDPVDADDRLVGQSIPVADEAALALLAGRGYTRRHTSWLLRLPADVEIETVGLPAGVVVRAARPGLEDRAVWRVVEDAFNEWPGRQPTPFEDWACSVVHRPGFSPEQLLVAVQGDDVVGACFVTTTDGVGWVHQVAVRRDRRGSGLARALLTEAGRVSRAHGAQVLELSTDSRTGALGLYEHVGMVVTETFEHWALRA